MAQYTLALLDFGVGFRAPLTGAWKGGVPGNPSDKPQTLQALYNYAHCGHAPFIMF